MYDMIKCAMGINMYLDFDTFFDFLLQIPVGISAWTSTFLLWCAPAGMVTDGHDDKRPLP